MSETYDIKKDDRVLKARYVRSNIVEAYMESYPYTGECETRLIILNKKDKIWIGSCVLLKDTKEIDELYIDDEYRNQGYASTLIKLAVSDYHMNFIKVLIDNDDAFRLYKKLGFKEYNRDKEMIYLKYK